MEDTFSKQLKAVPLSDSQREAKGIEALSGKSNLEQFGDFGVLDGLVRIYSGAYTHDDLYNSEVTFIYNLILYNRVSNYEESRKADTQRKLTKKP